jgi:hypothetical protein
MRRLVEAVERRQHRLERRALGVPCIGDGQLTLRRDGDAAPPSGGTRPPATR